ncbi:hypothetical protein BDV93DRAFT_548872 [Ceratobasidium sp. AG-I]|nr:hypothetical protein BDV93DRAFT_548872 [Ceratobasidium sp. AG-I]
MSFSLVPISGVELNSSVNLCGASSSAPPRADDLFPIPTPSNWETRREGTDPWYKLQDHTTFHILDYRKCRAGPTYHEYLVFHLTGEPGSIPDFDKESDLVARIHYPEPLTLLHVLDVCHAIQLDSNAKRYTLLYFNCYFFAWTIITLLARKIARWERAFEEPHWGKSCERLVSGLSQESRSSGKGKLAFRFERMVSDAKRLENPSIVEAVHANVFPQNTPLRQRSDELLWADEAGSIVADRLKHLMGRIVAEQTFHCLAPESANNPMRTGMKSQGED